MAILVYVGLSISSFGESISLCLWRGLVVFVKNRHLERFSCVHGRQGDRSSSIWDRYWASFSGVGLSISSFGESISLCLWRGLVVFVKSRHLERFSCVLDRQGDRTSSIWDRYWGFFSGVGLSVSSFGESISLCPRRGLVVFVKSRHLERSRCAYECQ